MMTIPTPNPPTTLDAFRQVAVFMDLHLPDARLRELLPLVEAAHRAFALLNDPEARLVEPAITAPPAADDAP